MTQGSPTTGELVARLRDRTEGTGIWRTAGPDEDLQALVAAVTTLERELEEVRARFEKHSDYSIQLQRIIEAICHGRELRPDSAELHHHKMAAGYMSASKAEVERLRELVARFLQRFELYAGPNDMHAGHHDLELLTAARAAIQAEESKP